MLLNMIGIAVISQPAICKYIIEFNGINSKFSTMFSMVETKLLVIKTA
jgi:hypothetical protein